MTERLFLDDDRLIYDTVRLQLFEPPDPKCTGELYGIRFRYPLIVALVDFSFGIDFKFLNYSFPLFE